MASILATLRMAGLALAALAVLDLAVAGFLSLGGALPGHARIAAYFDYGRSVPGKLARWQRLPGVAGNLFDVSWRDHIAAQSALDLAAEDAARGPVVRSYGMSFVDRIVEAAAKADPGVRVDRHSGPAAPPNFTYALFHDDRASRRAGDIAVLGVLASSLHGMASLSNRSWVFEQPAPFTYPLYRPAPGGGLTQIDPLVETEDAERALADDPAAAAAWTAQLAAHDANRTLVANGWPLLDRSPFARLVRRSLALDAAGDARSAVLGDWTAGEPDGAAFPYAETLRRIIVAFAETARSDGQVPVVLLVQDGQPSPDLLALTRATLAAHAVPYFATAEHVPPDTRDAFLSDSHFRPDIDAEFGRLFAAHLRRIRALPPNG